MQSGHLKGEMGRIRNDLLVAVSQSAQRATPTPAPSGAGLADEIQKLTNLRDQGALTESEFQALKARIIGR